jgi:hypothetical protein
LSATTAGRSISPPVSACRRLVSIPGLLTVGNGAQWGPMGPSAVAVRRDMRCGPCYLPGVDACSRSLACLTELRAEQVYEVARRMLLVG